MTQDTWFEIRSETSTLPFVVSTHTYTHVYNPILTPVSTICFINVFLYMYMFNIHAISLFPIFLSLHMKFLPRSNLSLWSFPEGLLTCKVDSELPSHSTVNGFSSLPGSRKRLFVPYVLGVPVSSYPTDFLMFLRSYRLCHFFVSPHAPPFSHRPSG